MNCHEVQDRLTDALLDEASTDEGTATLGHAAACRVCAEEAESVRQTLDLLRQSDWPAQAELVEERRRRLFERAVRPRPLVRWPLVAAVSGAAAAILAAVAIPSLLRARMEVGLPDPAAGRLDFVEPSPTVVPPGPPPQSPAASSGLQFKKMERLRSLGYLGSDGSIDLAIAGGVPGGVGGGVPGGVVGGVVAGVEAPRDMFFEHRGTNPFVATENDALSTFGLDVDTASYALARNYIRRGVLPPPEAVRVEEFVNALPQDYPAPSGKTFGIHLEAAPSPFRDGRTFLGVGIRAKDVVLANRKTAHLTFVVDISGSMGVENRLGLVRHSLRLLVDRLEEHDWIGLVVYGTAGRVVLQPTPVSDRESILDAIESLEPEGSTNLEEGLDLGYQMAARSYEPTANNRVVLCTDGVANNGVSDPRALLRQVKQQAVKGIDMIALGFGMGNYNDALLQKLADEGDGQYAYIDDYAEAKRFFLRDLTGVLETVARDARAQVEFDPARVERYRLIGYEKRDIADEDFRNDAVDAGEVNAGQTVTVLYELTLRAGEGPLGTARIRFVDPETGTAEEVHREIGSDAIRSSFEEASPRFQLTLIAARFAEHLRKSRWIGSESLQHVLDVAGRLPAATARTPEATGLVGLIHDAVRLSQEAND